MAHTYLHSFSLARYCFEKIFSIKLSKTLDCQIFEHVLFSFSQVSFIVIILKRYPVQNWLISAAVSYLPNISYFLHNFIYIIFV